MHRSFLNLIGHGVIMEGIRKMTGRLIGHGVVMEGIRKMTGRLQTFGGHCR